MAAAYPHRPQVPFKEVGIRCCRYTSNMKIDYENLCWSFKPIIDGLVDAGILEDDNMDIITQRDYKRAASARDKGYVTIELWSLDQLAML